MLREGESTVLLRMSLYSVLACALVWFGYQRFVIAYGAEVEAREELRSKSGGRAAEGYKYSRIAQVRKIKEASQIEWMAFKGVTDSVDKAVARLPLVRDIGPVVKILHSLADECGCRLVSARAEQENAEKSNPDLVRMRFNVALVGVYPALRAFATRLEAGNSELGGNPVHVPALSLARAADGRSVSADLQVEILGRSR